MKIKEIKIGFSYLKALPKYENMRFEESYTIDIEENDNIQEIKDKIYAEIKENIKKEIGEMKK